MFALILCKWTCSRCSPVAEEPNLAMSGNSRFSAFFNSLYHVVQESVGWHFQNSRWRPRWLPFHEPGHISATDHPIHFVFGFMVGFSGTVDRLALFSVRPNPRWRLGRRLGKFKWRYLRNKSSDSLLKNAENRLLPDIARFGQKLVSATGPTNVPQYIRLLMMTACYSEVCCSEK